MTAPEKVDPAQNPSGTKSFLTDESGATAAEYALIIALVAAAIVTALTTLGHSEGNRITAVANTIGGS